MYVMRYGRQWDLVPRATAKARLTVSSAGVSSCGGLRLMSVVSYGPPPW